MVQSYYHANCHADRREISVPRQKIHIFHIGDSPGGLPSHVIEPTFLESSCRANVTSNLT